MSPIAWIALACLALALIRAAARTFQQAAAVMDDRLADELEAIDFERWEAEVSS